MFGFQGANRQQIFAPGGLGSQAKNAMMQFRQAMGQGMKSGSLANWFAGQNPGTQMQIAAGQGGEQTPWGTLTGNMANRLMNNVRMTSPDWSNAGAQLQNYASYQNAATNPYAQNKGIMNFTPGGGSFGPSMWDTFNGGTGIGNTGHPGGMQQMGGMNQGGQGQLDPNYSGPGGGSYSMGPIQSGAQQAVSNLGMGGAGWQMPNAGSWNPYQPVVSGNGMRGFAPPTGQGLYNF